MSDNKEAMATRIGSPIHTFQRNSDGSDYVVGDIHGEYDKLMRALKKRKFDFKKDRLFSTGDLIDRGPDSYKCLQLIHEPWFFAVRGNHEQMAIEGIKHDRDLGFWVQNGGAWYLNDPDRYDRLIGQLDELLPFGIEINLGYKKVGIVHADVKHDDWDLNFSQFDEDVASHLLWDRRRAKGEQREPVSGVDILYVGHTPTYEKKVSDNVKFIDYGVVKYDVEFKLHKIRTK